jgi:hypothetical protein
MTKCFILLRFVPSFEPFYKFSMSFAGKDGTREPIVQTANLLQEFCITLGWTAFPEFDADFSLPRIEFIGSLEKKSINAKYMGSLFTLALIRKVMAFTTSEIWTGCIQDADSSATRNSAARSWADKPMTDATVMAGRRD